VAISINNVENKDKAQAGGLLKDNAELIANVTKLENDFTNYKAK
jgi:hypothetical protein